MSDPYTTSDAYEAAIREIQRLHQEIQRSQRWQKWFYWVGAATGLVLGALLFLN